MAVNLEKIIKVTQEQYNILASGGRVGDYVGLQDNYIYMIEDNNEYLPTTGGTITGNLTVDGTTTFKNNTTYTHGKGIEFLYNNGDYTDTGLSINCDNLDNEVIYFGNDETGHPLYKPLLANDNGDIIYSEDSDYYHDITLNTGVLTILDSTDTGNRLAIDADESSIITQSGNTIYNHFLPTQSGTIALTSDLSNYHAKNASVIPTANGTLDIGSSSYKYKDVYLSGNAYIQTISSTGQLTAKIANADKYYFTGSQFMPATNNSLDLGRSDVKWKDLYLSGSTYLGNTDHYIRKGTGNVVEIGANGSTILTLGSSSTVINSVFRANGDNVKDLGQPTIRWKDLYIAGSLKDGTNSLSVADIQPKLTAGTGIAISNNVISSTLEGIDYEVDSQLPASGQKGIIYLIPNGESGSENIYNEYIWIPAETSGSTSRFEFIGTTQTDLSNYVDRSSDQTIEGDKTFRSQIVSNSGITGSQTILSETTGYSLTTERGLEVNYVGNTQTSIRKAIYGYNGLMYYQGQTSYGLTYPTKSGTLAVTDDITVTDATDDILDATITNKALKYAPYTSRSAGHLYTGTTNPSSTNRLNYDGYFYATKLYSGGAEVKTTDNDHYPTTFTWTNGTTSGPTGSLTGTSGFTAVSFGAIPTASASQSGIVTTGNQIFAGNKTFNNNITIVSETNSSKTATIGYDYDDGDDTLNMFFFSIYPRSISLGINAVSGRGFISDEIETIYLDDICTSKIIDLRS